LPAAGDNPSTCGICAKPSGATSDTPDISGNLGPNTRWRLPKHYTAPLSKRDA
jgi:hypothetical protein